MAARDAPVCYEFGPFRLDVASRLLFRHGEVVPLTPKVFETLQVLVQQRGRVVDKAELLQRLWPDSFVEEGSLTQNVSLLRRALGEGAHAPTYILTIPRRGYRFVAQIQEVHDTPPAADRSPERSIAILPFKPLSPQRSDAHLGLGIADTLITRLSNLPQIAVRPTSAVLPYVGSEQDPVAIGRALRVAFVLEGSIRHASERLRVTVQVVSVHEQRPLWAAKFDEPFTDIFTVEDTIAEKVSAALMLQLSGEERQRLTKRPTENAEAYHLCLRGRYLFSQQTEEGVRRGIEYYHQAIEQDSTYALAYAWLADAYCWLSHFYAPPRDVMPKARAAALKARELDETLAEAHTALALVRLWYEWDFTDAEREFKHALACNPRYAVARLWYAFLLTALERVEEGRREIMLAHQMEPLSNFINSGAGFPFYFSRQYIPALVQAERMIEMEPHAWVGHWLLGLVHLELGAFDAAIAALHKAVTLSSGCAEMLAVLGYAYAVAGQHTTARSVLAELQGLSKPRYVSPYYVAALYAGLGETDHALAALDQAYDERSEWLVWAKVDPRLDRVRHEPRFASLLQRVGLMP